MRLAGVLLVLLLLPATARADTPSCTDGEPEVIRTGGTLAPQTWRCQGTNLDTRYEIVTPPRLGAATVRATDNPWLPGTTFDTVEYTAPRDITSDTDDPFTVRAAGGAPFTIRPVIKPATFNRAPECYASGFQTIEVDEPLGVSATCWDPDGDPVGPLSGTAATGTFTVTEGGGQYRVDPGFDPGPDGATIELSVTAADRPPAPATPLTSVPSTVAVRVIRADANPVCQDQEHTVVAGSGYLPVTLVCTDADPADDLKLSVTSWFEDQQVTGRGVVTARVAIPATGNRTLRPQFYVIDGDDWSAPGTVTIHVVDGAEATKALATRYLTEAVVPAVRKVVRGRGAKVGPFAIDVGIRVRAGRRTRALELRAGARRKLQLRGRAKRASVAVWHAASGARAAFSVRR